MTYLTALFVDSKSAERAYQGALDRGYKLDELDVVMSDETRMRQFGADENARTALLEAQGGAARDWVGLLIDSNIPEERVKNYERGVAQGGILIGVRPRTEDDAIHLEKQWRNVDGVDIYR